MRTFLLSLLLSLVVYVGFILSPQYEQYRLLSNVFNIYFENDGKATAFRLEIADEGVYITNNHVCERIWDSKASVHNEYFDHEVYVYAMWPDVDLCALRERIPRLFTGLHLGNWQDLGLHITIYGYPNLSGTLSISEGNIISFVHTVLAGNSSWDLRPMRVITLSAVGAPGSSGGPVIDDAGNVVGVVSSYNPMTNRMSAIPLEDLSVFVALVEKNILDEKAQQAAE